MHQNTACQIYFGLCGSLLTRKPHKTTHRLSPLTVIVGYLHELSGLIMCHAALSGLKFTTSDFIQSPAILSTEVTVYKVHYRLMIDGLTRQINTADI